MSFVEASEPPFAENLKEVDDRTSSINKPKVMTVEQVAVALGISPSSVQQIEQRALRKLERRARLWRLRGLLDA